MRILYFHQHFTTPSGSGGTRSYEIARALVEAGHRVTLVCGDNDRDPVPLPRTVAGRARRGMIDGIDVVALPIAYSNHLSIWQRCRVFLRFAALSIGFALREEYDVLYATSTPLTIALPGIVAKWTRAAPTFIFEVRDLWPELPKALGMTNPWLLAGMAGLEWAAYQSADVGVGLAPAIVAGIRRVANKNLPVALVPNGCDLEFFSPANRGQLDLPGISSGDFVAGFTGAHGIANGLGALLDAAAELKHRGRSDIKLVLIGDGREKASLEARAARDGLANCIFLKPMVKTRLAQVTAGFDCGLQLLANLPAFYYGTSPNKFFDYISSGLPVINNYPGWLADLIGEYDCGIAVRPEDPEAMADALCLLADNPAVRSRQGANARRLAETKFARRDLNRRLIALIESRGEAARQVV